MAGYKYLQKQENELINLMFSGSGEDVDGFVRDIISAHKDTSHVVMNTLYYNLLGTFFKCADRAGIKESFNSHELENIIFRLSSFAYKLALQKSVFFCSCRGGRLHRAEL